MKLLNDMKRSAAVYGITSWVAVVIIMYHVAYDIPVSPPAAMSLAWVVVALPLFFILDGLAYILAILRAKEAGQ